MSPTEKGKIFEDYVQDIMFPVDRYIVVRKTPNFEDASKRLIEDCNNPDFTFRRIRTGKEYSVEAKFRVPRGYNVNVCTEEQLERYRKYDGQSPTFIALGIGGCPSSPTILLFFHISKLTSTNIFLPDFFKDNYFRLNSPVFSKYMEKLLR
ncbi:hypothetical protein JSO60_06450 [Riemerella anatipestifer]|uniref:hypothetical protein n=1 Tax=Riemerella anatipestifer TaxID=34085 RepID=UPI0030C271B8